MSGGAGIPALYHMYHSSVLQAPLAQAWAELRDFSKTLKICFGDGVSDVHWLEHGSADRIPARISFALQPGNLVLQAEVTGRLELAHSVTYRTLGVALSFSSYVATYTL